MYKLGIIGVGNIGRSILKGALDTKVLSPKEVIIYDHNRGRVKNFLTKGVEFAKDELDLVKNSQYIVLAIKPQDFKDLGLKLKNNIDSDSVILSIATGITISQLKEFFGDLKFIRIMPNTPALVNDGMTAMTKGEKANAEELKFAKELFSSIGLVTVIEEKEMNTFSGIVSCLPAYVYMFIESAADAAVKNGMRRQDAYDYISQAVLGSAKMVRDTKKHPGELKDQVTSPGGTTIQGVVTLEEKGFRNAIIKAIDASINYKIDLD